MADQRGHTPTLRQAPPGEFAENAAHCGRRYCLPPDGSVR